MKFTKLLIVFLFLVCIQIQQVNAQFSYQQGIYISPEDSAIAYDDTVLTFFPNYLFRESNSGCLYGFDQPTDFNITYQDNNLITFSGGKRIGGNLFNLCNSLWAYATAKTDRYGLPTNLSDTITIRFPNPKKFSNIYVVSKPQQQIQVTLDGGISKTFDFTDADYHKSISWYDFNGLNAPPETSEIKIKSLTDNWSFYVYTVEYFREPLSGGGGGWEPPTSPENPLIFVPGIAGSQLRLVDTGEIRWNPRSPSALVNLSVLALNPDGTSVNNIDTPDVLRSEPNILSSLENVEIYNVLLDRLRSRNVGYVEYDRLSQDCTTNQSDKTLFVFPYDWRKSNTENTSLLKDYIDCVREIHPNKKVNILAHSMGGLLTRRYILDYPNDNSKINKVITLNSPFLGAPRAIHTMTTGSFIADASVAESPFPWEFPSYATALQMRQLANYFSGAHELLPSKYYFPLTNMNPFSVNDFWGNNTQYGYFDTKAWLNARHQISLPYNRNENFHDYVNSQGNKQDDWRGDTTGIEYYHLYSKQSTNRTVGHVRVEPYTACTGLSVDCVGFTMYRPFPVEGDGTVPLISAKRVGNGIDLNYMANSQSNPFRFLKKPTLLETDKDANHNDSLKNPIFINEIVKILNNKTNHSLIIDTDNNLVEEPQKESYYISLSNVDRYKFDGVERVNDRNGVNPPTETNLSGSSVTQTGDKSLWIATPAYATEKFTFKNDGRPMIIEIVKGIDYENATEYTKYTNLVLPADSAAQLDISPNGVQNLWYDTDGDEIPDTNAFPDVFVTGENAKDINSPILSYNFQLQGAGQLLTLSATDSQSGLKQIRYSLDGQNFTEYTNPVLIDPTQVQRVYAFAEDNNLNTTGISTINVPLSPTAANATISGKVINQKERPISRATITLTAINGTFSKTVTTNNFGRFTIDEVPSGNDYVISASRKGYSFNSQVISVTENLQDLVISSNG